MITQKCSCPCHVSAHGCLLGKPKCCDQAGMLHSFLDSFREFKKYAKVWKTSAYRAGSPGADAISRGVMDLLGARPGQSVVDLGCGAGAAMTALRERGYHAVGVDFVDAGARPLVPACLWDMPVVQADYGICIDVMEHIPPDYVSQTLTNVMRCADQKTYFQIAMFPDHFGPKLLGEPLHLSVFDEVWWTHVFHECGITIGNSWRDTSYGDAYPYFCVIAVR